MNRITDAHLDAKVNTVNTLLGYETPVAYSTDGAVTLYKAYGSTAVRRFSGPHGGESTLSDLGTKREAAIFLDAMIKTFRIVQEK